MEQTDPTKKEGVFSDIIIVSLAIIRFPITLELNAEFTGSSLRTNDNSNKQLNVFHQFYKVKLILSHEKVHF